MEILNWKFNEQSSRHEQHRATILRKCISHHVFHLLLWHARWCQKRLVSLSLTKDGQEHTWMAQHGLFFRKCPATSGISITELMDALFTETFLFNLLENKTIKKTYWKMWKRSCVEEPLSRQSISFSFSMSHFCSFFKVNVK